MVSTAVFVNGKDTLGAMGGGTCFGKAKGVFGVSEIALCGSNTLNGFRAILCGCSTGFSLMTAFL
jgi:hypothetical protein